MAANAEVCEKWRAPGQAQQLPADLPFPNIMACFERPYAGQGITCIAIARVMRFCSLLLFPP